jgi:hypothetical protein
MVLSKDEFLDKMRMELVGVAHPKPKDASESTWRDLKQEEMPLLMPSFKGMPVIYEHDPSNIIGTVTDAKQANNGSVVFNCELFKNNDFNQGIIQKVKNGELRDMSISYTTVPITGSEIPYRKPFEVSMVEESLQAGAKIYAWRDEGTLFLSESGLQTRVFGPSEEERVHKAKLQAIMTEIEVANQNHTYYSANSTAIWKMMNTALETLAGGTPAQQQAAAAGVQPTAVLPESAVQATPALLTVDPLVMNSQLQKENAELTEIVNEYRKTLKTELQDKAFEMYKNAEPVFDPETMKEIEGLLPKFTHDPLNPMAKVAINVVNSAATATKVAMQRTSVFVDKMQRAGITEDMLEEIAAKRMKVVIEQPNAISQQFQAPLPQTVAAGHGIRLELPKERRYDINVMRQEDQIDTARALRERISNYKAQPNAIVSQNSAAPALAAIAAGEAPVAQQAQAPVAMSSLHPMHESRGAKFNMAQMSAMSHQIGLKYKEALSKPAAGQE